MTRRILGAETLPQRFVEVKRVRFSLQESEHFLESSPPLRLVRSSETVLINPADQEAQLKNKSGHDVYVHNDIVQIIPTEQGLQMYVATSNRCCDGAVSSYDIHVDDKLSVEPTGTLYVPFNTHGLMMARSGQGVVYGSGCAGSGIMQVDLKKTEQTYVYKTPRADQNDPMQNHYDAQYSLFFNPPKVDNGKIVISWFDGNQRFQICDTAPPGIDWMIHDMIRHNPSLKSAVELTIDDFMTDVPVWDAIKEQALQSHYLYATGLPSEIATRSLNPLVMGEIFRLSPKS